MKKIALVFGIALIAMTAMTSIAMACTSTIYGIQTDPVANPLGSLGVICDATVTGICGNGFYVQEELTGVNPNGEFSGIWVYTGTPPTVVVGDVLEVCGIITEFFDLTELDVVAGGIYGYVLKTGDGVPYAPYTVTAAQIVADGEPWESVQIQIVDGLEVPLGFDLGFGEWQVNALDGTVLRFDDCFYDFSTVMEGHCYNNATGIYTYSFGNFKLEPFAGGIDIVNCAVGSELITLGTVKAMFR